MEFRAALQELRAARDPDFDIFTNHGDAIEKYVVAYKTRLHRHVKEHMTMSNVVGGMKEGTIWAAQRSHTQHEEEDDAPLPVDEGDGDAKDLDVEEFQAASEVKIDEQKAEFLRQKNTAIGILKKMKKRYF